jgi:C4-dicarboxylate-specific signal transduction histidine kinase
MEDLQLAVGKARADLQASDVGFGDTARQASQILEGLAREVEKIGRRLPGKVKAELEDVDCMLLAKEESARHIGGQIPHPMPISAAENCVVRTYREEIQDALNEILQNAVDAVNELETFPSPPAVWINIRNTEIKDLGKCVEIAVSNKGNRFDEEARKNLYKPDNCHWTKDRSRHKGTGLYVASRMMMAVGGRLEVESSEEGSNVTLVVKDWS